MESPRVHDLDRDAFGLEAVCRTQRVPGHQADRGDREVGPFAEHAALPQRHDDILAVGHVASRCPERPVVEHDDRIRVADRRLQQTLGVRGGGRQDDLHAPRVHDQGVRALGVLGRHARTAAGSADDRQREVAGASHHVAEFRGLVEDLVHRHVEERRHEEVDDGHEPRGGSPKTRADEGGLRDRRVADPVRPELVRQSRRVADDAPPHVLTHDDDPVVTSHLLENRRPHGRRLGPASH